MSLGTARPEYFVTTTIVSFSDVLFCVDTWLFEEYKSRIKQV